MTRKPRSALKPAEIIRSPRLELANRVEEMTTSMLRAELARALTVTAETLTYLAAVWRELDRRGEDLSDLRKGMGYYIPLIASGQLAAEAVVHFAGRISLLRAVQTLPIDEQRRLALGGKVRVVTLKPSGRLDEADLPVTSLTGEQIKIVFDIGRMRPPVEQTNMLSSAQIKAQRRGGIAQRNYKIKINKADGVFQVGRMTLPVTDVIDALTSAGVLPARKS